MTYHHHTVLGPEVTEWLAPQDHGSYLDVTLGGGGHSLLLLEAARAAQVIGIDRDQSALQASQDRLKEHAERFLPLQGSFSQAVDLLTASQIEGVDGIVADLGVSSPQLDHGERGFSLRRSGPLDMRMGQHGETLESWLQRVDESTLRDIIWRYGEERHARRIAAAIIAERPFPHTLALAELIQRVVPGREGRIHKATRTFQALRIHINEEMSELDRLLADLPALLKPGARVAIISYHSLEDRKVKRAFRGYAGLDSPRDAWGHPVQAPRARILTRKPQLAPERDFPRGRSAKLRVLEWGS